LTMSVSDVPTPWSEIRPNTHLKPCFSVPERRVSSRVQGTAFHSIPNLTDDLQVNPRILPSQLEISVERRVERTSDELSDIIRQDSYGQRYQYHRPRSPRHTSEHMRSLP
jgi:hypothetical protein